MSHTVKVTWSPVLIQETLDRLVELRDEGGGLLDDVSAMCAIDCLRSLARGLDLDKLQAECGEHVRRSWPGEGTAHQALGLADLAKLHHWRAYHTYDSRRCDPGFPDLLMVKPPRLVAIECKSERGRVTFAQQRWLADLAGAGVETMVARPSMWDDVVALLGRR